MRVLLSGAFNPRFEALPDYLAAALRRLGHDVALFDHRRFLLPGRLRQRSAWLQRLDLDRLNRSLLRLARAFRPEQVIVNQGTSIAPDTLRRLRRQGARCVNWYSDFPAEFEAGLRLARDYDVIHLASSWAARRHRREGHANAFWLPFGCDEVVHVPSPVTGADAARFGPPADRRERRVVLVGSHYPERQILLRFLRGLPVDVWGPGWERAASDPHVAPMLRGGSLRPKAWVPIYSGAAAVLNIHYGAFGPNHVSGEMASTRAFEIPACGALQIADRCQDLVRLFREGEHFLGFAAGDELRARVEEALADESRAAAIAVAARRLVLREHTYTQRAAVLLGQAAALEPAEPEAARLIDPAIWRQPSRAAGGQR